MFRIFFTVIFLTVFGVTASYADPSSSILWLMDERASIFDVGMVRMRIRNKEEWTPSLMKELNGKGLKLGGMGVGSVVYDWDKNTINITAPLIGNPTENICSDALKKFKKIISPYSVNSKMRYLFMAGEFGHVNYTSKNRPKDLNENLSKLIVFTVGISNKTGFGSGKKSIFCSERLDSDIPSFTKIGFDSPSR